MGGSTPTSSGEPQSKLHQTPIQATDDANPKKREGKKKTVRPRPMQVVERRALLKAEQQREPNSAHALRLLTGPHHWYCLWEASRLLHRFYYYLYFSCLSFSLFLVLCVHRYPIGRFEAFFWAEGGGGWGGRCHTEWQQWSRLKPSHEFLFGGLSNSSLSFETLVRIQDVSPRI